MNKADTVVPTSVFLLQDARTIKIVMGHLSVINLQSEKMRKLSSAQSHLKDAVINLLQEQTLFSIVLI